MKKVILLIFAVLLTVSLFACGVDTTKNRETVLDIYHITQPYKNINGQEVVAVILTHKTDITPEAFFAPNTLGAQIFEAYPIEKIPQELIGQHINLKKKLMYRITATGGKSGFLPVVYIIGFRN